MRKNEFKVSKLKKAINNPVILEKAKTMYPDLNGMSDADFARLVADANNRCDQFIRRYGDLNGEEIVKLGAKQIV